MNKTTFSKIMRRRFFKIILVIIIVFTVLHFIIVPPVGEFVENIAWSNSRFVDIYGFKVHYIDQGEGDTLYVLLHGFGASVFTWREVVGNLSSSSRIAAFDRPGFGLTERIDPSKAPINPYHINGAVELTCKFIELIKRNESRIIIVGHSAGGGLALLVFLRCNISFSAFILIAPAWKPYTKPLYEKILYSIPLADKYGPLMARALINQLEGVLYKAWYNKSLLTNHVIEGYKYPLKARDWDKGLYWLMKYREFPDIRNDLSKVGIPVLIIHGLKDEIVPIETSIELYNLLSKHTKTKLVTLDQCGHLPHEEKPQEFLKELYIFVHEVFS